MRRFDSAREDAGERQRVRCAAVVMLLVFAASAVLFGRDSRAPAASESGPRPPTPLWTADVPSAFTESVSTRFAGDIVVLTSTAGVLVHRATTGERLWQRAVNVDEVTPSVSGFHTVIAGDALVIVYGENEDHQNAFDVLDLATGRFRWRSEHGAREDDTRWFNLVFTATTIIVGDCAYEYDDPDAPPPYTGRCALTSRSLADGARVWSREVRGANEELPVVMSPDQAHDDSAYRFDQPLDELDPDTRFFLVLDLWADGVTVVDTGTGEIIGSWRLEDGVGIPQIQGGHLVVETSDGEELRGLDPVTGATLWTRPFYPYEEGGPYPVSLIPADVYVDMAPDSRGCRLIDVATGARLPVESAGWPLLAITSHSAVGYDGMTRTLTAVETTTGNRVWSSPLDLELGAGQHSRSYADDGFLVFTAFPDRPGGPDPRTWLVELASGRIGVLPGVLAIGYADGVLATLSASPDRPGTSALQLWSLG